MHILKGALLGALRSPVSVIAQTAAPQPVAPASVVAPVAAANQAVLRVGTEVPLRLSETLTTKNKQVRVGQRFRMEVAEAVQVNGQVVIPVGTPAVGEVTDVRNKGMWGKSGHIGARLLYVQVNGRQIRLSGTFDDKGVTGTAGVVAAVALIPVAGFFTTGTSANLPIGSSVKGFVDEDVPLAMEANAPAPLAVAAAPAAVAVSTATTAAPVASPAVAQSQK